MTDLLLPDGKNSDSISESGGKQSEISYNMPPSRWDTAQQIIFEKIPDTPEYTSDEELLEMLRNKHRGEISIPKETEKNAILDIFTTQCIVSGIIALAVLIINAINANFAAEVVEQYKNHVNGGVENFLKSIAELFGNA